jgi:PadR family transcriptional regulator PadR
MARRTELLKGTLDLLILKTLELEPRHGLGVAERMEQITRGAFSVKPGSLFPALHRLEEYGYLTGEWTASDEGRRVKSYRLTAAGRRQLAAEKRQWARITLAVAQILESS